MKKEFATYSRHYKDTPEGHIFLQKEGACTITLEGAMAMTQKELDEIASQIFGFSRMTFREFVGEYSKYRTDFILGSFPPNADIIGENDDDDEIDWQFILSQ